MLVIGAGLHARERIFQTEWQLVLKGLAFPEGPAWAGDRLYLSNCYSDWIAIYQNGQIDTLRLKSESDARIRTNGLVFRQGYLYACDFGLKQVIRLQNDGRWHSLTSGVVLQRPNDLTFDAKGNLYFTDSGNYRRENPDGTLWCIQTGDGKVVKLSDNLAFPNGITFSPDGSYLYLAESAKQIVMRYRIGSKGQLDTPEVFAELPGGDPDGLTCDEAGNLYVAHFGNGCVWVLAPDGRVLEKIKTPGQKPSNLEFGDSDRRTLYLTETETNSLYRIRTTTRGSKLE